MKDVKMEFRTLDWMEIKAKIESFATSSAAKSKIQVMSALKAPEALKSVDNIFSAASIIAAGIRPHMTSLDFYPNWHTRLKKKAVLKNLEMKDIRLFCHETLALSELLQSSLNDWAQKTAQGLMNAERPLSAIDQIFSPQGEIRSDASEKLFQLHNEREKLARDIQNTLDRLVRDHEMENYIQDKYVTTREGRWVLPIRSGSQHWVPGVIHGSSQSKQTVFIEPEKIVPVNNRLRQVEVEIEEEIERLITELSYFLHTLWQEFESTKEILESTDEIFAKAQFSVMIGGKPFEFSENVFDLNSIQHPLLKLLGKGVVPNNVLLDQTKSILLLSGPNAGGKTVLLKSIGLAAQMARCGLPLCADEGSKLPYFKDIMIGIGDSQSVDEELSTFAAHLKILDESTKYEGPQSLILIDEICGSTDPEEGSALARSFIERYSQNQVFAVITSHLGPLKSGWSNEDRILNGSLEYDIKSGRPTYQFISGLPGDSLALQMAKRVGVDAKIVGRAVELLSPATRKRLESLEEIEQMKSDVNLLQEHLKKETQKAQQLKMKYEKLMKEFETEKESKLDKVIKQAAQKVDEVISQVKVDQTFKKHQALQEIKTQLPEIVKAKPQPATSMQIENADDFSLRYPPGSKVFIPSLNQDGIIQSLPNSKGEVFILASSMRLQLSWQVLRPPEKPVNPTSKILRQNTHTSVPLQTEDRVVDVRGKTASEALEELEFLLDQAVQLQEDRIKIIHGHGTEVLKKAVRTFLSRSLYVKKWKAGGQDQGGDGVTWAEIGKD